MGMRAAPSHLRSGIGAGEDTMPAAHPVFFLLFTFLSFLGIKKRIYATAPAHMDPGPGSLGLNSAAQTPFFKQDVEFLMVCREERFHPDLSGCAVCSRVPYECVGLSVMGRKHSLQHLKGRNFQQTKHSRRQETCCCSSILNIHLFVCRCGFKSAYGARGASWKREIRFSCLPRKQQNDCWMPWNCLEKLISASWIQAWELHIVTAPCVGSTLLLAMGFD